MMHQINERADYSAEFWSLIHLESELMVASVTNGAKLIHPSG
ncbi:TPA: hypothetical protein ACU9M2_004299 [Enterobacter hormaechei]|nr:Uncharacterised protein [Enterobacter kobei]